jgi:hypothetical protein
MANFEDPVTGVVMGWWSFPSSFIFFIFLSLRTAVFEVEFLDSAWRLWFFARIEVLSMLFFLFLSWTSQPLLLKPSLCNTGSAHAVMAPYWSERLGKSVMSGLLIVILLSMDSPLLLLYIDLRCCVRSLVFLTLPQLVSARRAVGI